MADAFRNSTEVTVAENAEIYDSYVGCIINKDKSLGDILEDSYNQVVRDIKETQKPETAGKMLGALDNINDYFKNNMPLFESLLRQVNCKLDKGQESKALTVVRLLSFLTIINCFENSITLPDTENHHISIKGHEKNWLFNAAQLSEMSLEKHISNIAEYFARTPNSRIREGNCFLTMLLPSKKMDCSCCDKGLLKDTYIKILSSFVDSDNGWEKSFFDLQLKRDLVFFCGKCMSNIHQCEYANEILEGF